MNTNPVPTPTPPKSSSKRKRWIVLLVFLGLGVAGYALLTDVSCLAELYTCFKFGNFGGGQQRNRAKSFIKSFGKFNPQTSETKYGIRWYPTYVHFGPDGDMLLVSLCHVKHPDFCRIGKYSIAKNHWDILPFEEDKIYMEPVFSPDGQWIVTTMAGTINGMAEARTLRLVKMRPDGSQVQDLISAGVEKPVMNELLTDYQRIHPGNDIQATGATFSHNGKRLIYWRQFNLREKDAPAFAVLYTLDWETGKETLLAGRRPFFDRHNGRPFLTPDGERFVFSAAYPPHGVTPEEKEFVQKNNFFIANIKDAPILKGELLQKLQALPSEQGWWGLPLDIDRQGRVLYQGSLEIKKKEGNPAATAIRQLLGYKEAIALNEEQKKHTGTLTDEQYRQGEGTRRALVKYLLDDQYQKGGGAALFLRKPDPDAQDEVAFDAVGRSASVSTDGQHLAFTWGAVSIANNTSLGLLKLGDPMRNIRFIDWPKLDLLFSPPDSSKKP
ncbi:MAG: hypothetical protein H6R18_1132 [Proteobacteria bacterium]|nr:hypothetical protein [Pseudomonadota bacterium]